MPLARLRIDLTVIDEYLVSSCFLPCLEVRDFTCKLILATRFGRVFSGFVYASVSREMIRGRRFQTKGWKMTSRYVY